MGTKFPIPASGSPNSASELGFYSGRDRRRSGDLTLFRPNSVEARSTPRLSRVTHASSPGGHTGDHPSGTNPALGHSESRSCYGTAVRGTVLRSALAQPRADVCHGARSAMKTYSHSSRSGASRTSSVAKPVVVRLSSISSRLRNRSVESEVTTRPSRAKRYEYRKDT